MHLPTLFSTAFAVVTCVIADNPISPGFPYGSTKVRGVNLGGWLVLEPWITPSIFDNTGDSRVVDEWTYGQYVASATATSVLTNHWNTWITQSDFAAIAAAGLNHVRIPIGYWAFQVGPGEPYHTGQLPYLQKAVSWAGTYGLKVIVDLHGAPGSQNGFDNSGQRLSYPGWHSNNTNIQRTDTIIKQIASLFTGNPNVVAMISPLNEPAGFDGSAVLTPLKQFYYDSYGNVRYPNGPTESNTVLLLHDAFQPLSYWSGYQIPPNWQGVAMDTHIYQVFSNSDVAMSQAQHISTACSYGSSLSGFDLWLVVGEWSPAATDCAKYLNGRGIGARYDGSYSGSPKVGSCTGLTGAASSFSSSYKTFLRQYWEAQVIAFERGAQGWIQWDWKNENADEWSYQAGLANGWIPSPPTALKYPTICG
ncbi:glycoside hydrolase family 5 protein [Sistotremastrum niveocremeum HHB9708]|uniref:Glycoside hydrolase family 5 protein n=1 Tax=Sistotremastrum niveocremeum HHB9708 TaxID=1314777 RepID=A0A164USS5_9AGAM|nr:glycoside hydrolase family 5 protein [Sistotremastrum niveocremeum HHB9708]